MWLGKFFGTQNAPKIKSFGLKKKEYKGKNILFPPNAYIQIKTYPEIFIDQKLYLFT